MQVISIGEVLWDVFGQREFLGGAPLNFSVTATRLGNSVALLTAVGAERRGTAALKAMQALGLTTRFVQVVTEVSTGTAIVVTDSGGNATYVIERPAAFDCLSIDEELLDQLRALRPNWIYFGTLAQTQAGTEQALNSIVRRIPCARCFYDLNLRLGHWNLPLVQRLSAMATVLKMNDSEAEVLFRLTLGPGTFSLERFCKYWSSTYGMEIICITLGSKGCAVFAAGELHTFDGYWVEVVDTVGAGDAFSAAFLHGLDLCWPVERIASFANALGALVASRAGATPNWTTQECVRLISSSGVPADR